MYSLKRDQDGYIDHDGTWHENPSSWVWSILGGCGCGSSDDFGDKALFIIKEMGKSHKERSRELYDSAIVELFLHWMSAEKIIEHGTSVSGGWLTDSGKEILEAINKIEESHETPHPRPSRRH